MTFEDAEKYLKRIRFYGDLTPTIDTLRNLMQSHLFNVPFENLDIHYGTRIRIPDSFNKIVLKKRGGFCYELNSLFYSLLRYIGYEVRLVSARVYDGTSDFGPEFDHMAIIASFEGREYLIDVGFGEFAFNPLPLEMNKELPDLRAVFVMEKYGDHETIVKRKMEGGKLAPEYVFSRIGRREEEFFDMCIYHQTSERSHFTQKRLCSLPTPDGRITLTGMTLKRSSNGIIEETDLADENEFREALKKHFDIELSNSALIIPRRSEES